MNEPEITLIGREELKAKLDRGDDFKLLMTLGNWAFRMGHIPGSLNISKAEEAQGLISPDDEIVVYCSNALCTASQAAYHVLLANGFTNVRRYAGGIADWQEAGYPLESDPLLPKTQDLKLLSQPVDQEDHSQGLSDAPVTLVVYGDYECPYTRRAMIHVKGLQRRLGDELRFAYRHFPAPPELHPHAHIASEAGLAAGAQGKFWPMHHHLFSHQKALTMEDLVSYAGEFDLDVVRFQQEMQQHSHQRRIQRDLDSGMASGVQGIPTLFINDQRYEGELKLEAILKVISRQRRNRQ